MSYSINFNILSPAGKVIETFEATSCFAAIWHLKKDIGSIHYFPYQRSYYNIPKFCEELLGISYRELQLWYLQKMESFGCLFYPVIDTGNTQSQRLQDCIDTGFKIKNNFGTANLMLEATIIRYIEEYPNILVTWYKLLQDNPELSKSKEREYMAFSIANSKENLLGMDKTKWDYQHNWNHFIFPYAHMDELYRLSHLQHALSGEVKIGFMEIHNQIEQDAVSFGEGRKSKSWPYPHVAIQTQIDWIVQNVE